MGRRGFKSLAELTATRTLVIERPDAPYNLTDAEAEEWRAIVSAMAADYFARSHYPMLSQLCRHIVASNRIAQLIESTCRKRKLDESRLAALLALQGAESNAIVRLCRQLRLSHQAVYRPVNIKTRPEQDSTIAPWNVANEGSADEDESEESE